MDDLVVIAQLEGEPLGEGGLVEGVVLEEEHAEEDAFPPFEPTFFASQVLWLVITFVALYLLMSRLVLPRIGGILEDRRDRIARDLDQADRLKQQADDAIASYERALAEARAGAFTIAAEARGSAKQEANARQAEVEAKLDVKLADAEKRIADVKAKALADVGEIAAEAAEAVVQRLLGKKPTTAELKDALKAAGAANV
jgi:F-type H+-transporting ATPase subunit b